MGGAQKSKPQLHNSAFMKILPPTIESKIKETIGSISRDGKLKRNQFQDVLAVLNEYYKKIFSYSPLGQKLFEHLAKFKNDSKEERQNENYVEQNTHQILISILSNQETGIEYTFKAYCPKGDKITKQQFRDFIMASWNYAFDTLATELNKQQKDVQIQKLKEAANGQKVEQEIDKLFSSIAQKNKKINKKQFIKWIEEGQIPSVTARCGDIICEVPLNFYHLEINTNS